MNEHGAGGPSWRQSPTLSSVSPSQKRRRPRSTSAGPRHARVADTQACAEIYAPYVSDTAITFETDPPPPMEMAERGFRTAVAGMTLPNDASVGLHRAMGFRPVRIYRRIGWKHGRWHDVAWVQRTLATGQDPPVELR